MSRRKRNKWREAGRRERGGGEDGRKDVPKEKESGGGSWGI